MLAYHSKFASSASINQFFDVTFSKVKVISMPPWIGKTIPYKFCNSWVINLDSSIPPLTMHLDRSSGHWSSLNKESSSSGIAYGNKAPRCKQRGIEPAEIKLPGISFTLHDLRRTFVTIAKNIDMSAYALKRLVNHKITNDVRLIILSAMTSTCENQWNRYLYNYCNTFCIGKV